MTIPAFLISIFEFRRQEYANVPRGIIALSTELSVESNPGEISQFGSASSLIVSSITLRYRRKSAVPLRGSNCPRKSPNPLERARIKEGVSK